MRKKRHSPLICARKASELGVFISLRRTSVQAVLATVLAHHTVNPRE
jgi:hypothetical protein